MRAAASRLIRWISTRSRWQAMLLSIGAGATMSLALPPNGFLAVLFVCWPVLIWLLDGARGQARPRLAAFARGWAFGFGYFAASLYWIGHAFLVEADVFAWLMPLAVAVLPAGLALFWGTATILAQALCPTGPWRAVALGVAVSLMEWLRGHVLTGFPWNAPGSVVDAVPVLLQSASVLGLYGLNLLTLFVAALPVLLVGWMLDGQYRRQTAALSLGIVVALCAACLFGAHRLQQAGAADVPGVTLRIVQPNIAQTDKWRSDQRQANINRYFSLSGIVTPDQPAGLQGVTHLVWPESALPVLIGPGAKVLDRLADLLPPKTVLMFGALRAETKPRTPASRPDVFNSLMLVDTAGRIVASYDKRRLVPFGEYLPFASLLEPLGLRNLVPVPIGFSSSTNSSTLEVPGAPPVGALICYEAIFAGEVVTPGKRPGWLLQVTNDAWFGSSIGPYQHFAQARMRAVEEGLPLVRAANTGMSAVIDGHGRVKARLGLETSGVIDARLPGALPATVYARWPDYIFWLLIVAFSTVCLYFRPGIEGTVRE